MPAIVPVLAAIAGAAATTAIVAAGYSILFATVVGTLIYGAIAAYGAKKFAPDEPSFSFEATDRLQTIRSSIQPRRVIYGQTMVSGALVYAESTGSTKEFLHMVIALAGHEVEEIGDVYFGDRRSEEVDSDFFRINKHLGARDQAADGDLVAELTNWTGAHRLRGIAHLYVRLKYSQDVWPNGVPNIKAIVKGKKIWDPRDSGVSIASSTAITGGTVQFETDVAHGFSTGDPVFISGHQAGGDIFGEYTITVDDATHFTVDEDVATLTGGGSGGTAYLMKYSTNPALCRLDYLTQDFGLNAGDDEIDTANFTAAANVCDEQVTLSSDSSPFTSAELAPTTAPTPTALGSQTTPKAYKYKVTFITAAGETDPGPESSSVQASSPSPTIDLTAIPKGGLYVTGRKVYRTEGDGATFKLLTTINDNKTTTYRDTTADSSLGAAAPASNTALYPSDIMARSDETFDMAFGSIVRFSTTGTLPSELAAATDYYYIRKSRTDFQVATSLANALAGLVVSVTTVTGADPGTGTHTMTRSSQLRYDCNGAFGLSVQPIDIMNDLLTADAGVLVYTQGKYTTYPAAATAQTASLDEDDLRGPLEMEDGPPRRELFNAVGGVYVNPDGFWQPTEFPPVTNRLYELEDGFRIKRDLEMPFTTNSTRAQRLAKIRLEQSRQGVVVKMPCKLTALKVAPWDVVQLSISRLGWTNKEFRVISWQLAGDSNGIGVDLTLKEEAAAVYDWDSGAETQVDPAPDSDLPDLSDPLPPTSLELFSGTGELFLAGDGTVVSRIHATWTVAADIFVIQYEIQARNITTGEAYQTVAVVSADTTDFYISPAEDGEVYDVRIRSINVNGVRGSFVEVAGHAVIGKTEVPANVTGFIAAQNGAVAVFRWTQVTDVDLAGYEIRYGAQGSATWADATPLTKVTRGTNITTADIPPGDWTCLIKAVDTSGNYSTTADSDDLLFSNVQGIIFQKNQAPDWLGTRTNFVRHWAGALVPDSQNLASADGWETFDQFVVNPFTNCTYEADEIDVDFDDTVRMWAGINTVLGPGETDTNLPQIQVDYRKDADAYDGFENWTIGNREARYIKFKFTYDTSPGVAKFTKFDPTVDIIEETQRASGVTVSVGGTAITYPNRFHNKPTVELQAIGSSPLIEMADAVTVIGFTAYVFDSGGVDVGGTVDWEATGV